MENTEIPKVLTIYAEATPNPETLKFVLNKMIVPNQVFEFQEKEDAGRSPLAIKLFEFDFVNGVFIMNNFVSVTKKSAYKWVDLIPTLRETIRQFIEDGMPVVDEELLVKSPAANNVDEDSVAIKVKEILSNQVKPAVEMDGGFIEFKSYNAGVVTLILRGACSGCPSSMVTLKSGIEALLKRFIPEVNEVVAESR